MKTMAKTVTRKKMQARRGLLLTSLFVCLLFSAAANVWGHQVVTIYFCGTGIKSDAYLPENTSWKVDPELLSTMYQHDNSVEIEHGPWVSDFGVWSPPRHTTQYTDPHHHHKYIVNGIGTSPGTNLVDLIWQILGTADPNLGSRSWHNVIVEAQEALLEAYRYHQGEDYTLNLVGFSRGGISTMMMARALTDESGWEFVKKINILAYDPVPGGLDPIGALGNNLHLSDRVNQYVGLYAEHERTYQFEPVIPASELANATLLVRVPGAHETMVGNHQKDGHFITLAQINTVGEDTREVNFHFVEDVARAIAERLLTSYEWGNVPLVLDTSNWPEGTNSKARFDWLLTNMWTQDYSPTSLYAFAPAWGSYDGIFAHPWLGRDYMLRILVPWSTNYQGRLCFVAPYRHAIEYIWWLPPFVFPNAEQVYWLEQKVPRVSATTWDILESLRGSPPPDNEPPEPTVDPLPPVTGECSVTVTAPPTATDDVSGTVIGTTTAPLTYDNQGTYSLTWTYTDRSGKTSTQRQNVIVADTRPPIPNLDPLDTVRGQCSAQIPIPSAVDNCSGTIEATTSDPLSYTAQGTYTVRWTYDDRNGNTATQSQTVIVEDTVPPTFVAAPLSIEKPTDPGACSAVVSYEVTAADNCAVSLAIDPPSNSVFPKGMTPVTAIARDPGGHLATRTFQVTVEDKEPPVIAAPPNVAAYIEAGLSSWGVLITDQALGAAVASDNCNQISVTRSGVPPDNFFPVGTTTITHTAVDAAGNTATATQLVVVIDNIGPIASTLDAAPNPVSVGANVALTAALDERTSGRSNLASAQYSLDNGQNWFPMSARDGYFDSPVEDVSITIDAFSNAGVYDVCVLGADIHGNTGDKACILLAVYDPEGSFVTGGGWIISPTGAYAADPSLTGKVTLGFVSKYQQGAAVPTGQTEFQFKMGNLNFHSDSYEWLVVAGAKAQYKGSGTINGIGNYGFMLIAFDGEVDTIRIKIWDKATDTVVYDNQRGASDTENPTTALGGGSIVIH